MARLQNLKEMKWYQWIDAVLLSLISLSVILFILIPFLFVFKESFWSNGQFTLENFRLIFQDNLYLVENSLKVAFWATLIGSAASIAVALYYYFAGKWERRIIFAILAVTMISPPFITSLSYITLFGRRGYITYEILGLSTSPYGMWGIILMQALGAFSLHALLLIGQMSNMDPSAVNSARSLGASTTDIIKDILLPAIKPGIKVVVLLTFLASLSDFGTPTIIGGAFDVLASESYFAVIAEGNLAKASAINVLILLPSLLAFVIYLRSFGGMRMSTKGATDLREVRVKRTGWLYYLVQATAIFFLVWISIQYLSIILSAFTTKQAGETIFTLQNVIDAVPYINDATVRSIGYSIIAALGGGLIGLLIAYYLKIRRFKLMRSIDFIATLPQIIPGTFYGIGYILAFNSPPLKLTGTALIVLLNVLFKELPFSTKVGAAAMEDISQASLDSVSDLGGSHINEVTDVIVPVSRNALSVSFVNGFTSTMNTVGSIIFLVTPSTKLLTLVLFEVVQSGKYDIASVIALVMLFICLVANGLFMLLSRRRA